ncbi:penicillin-binding transpeptidase domain-containing protein [Vagococcus carniphilus]|uniref:penicillin-binding protein PBP4(5) n=1 Tax=Vagococcus carniphilus TaxID=218144 RepID=UPI00288FB444|nr:penicillin-binding transpeptidase domain-containing protein [Vagococcus carniphilus]MDT2829797.1 penicillin-binding transpeptidase domain-containing protein [Vagococcus carniphilus]MDT2839256.1 penicillin-binding transpeptidase domain-containing protein [Vagococcus carniphilus]MDT2853315.1 penicillin-binding transpeptidase domain-containing protein [Vagococcus carniphilus]
MSDNNQKRTNKKQAPKNKKGIILGSSVAGLLLVGVGGYFAYQKYDENLRKDALISFMDSFEAKKFKEMPKTLSHASLKEQGLTEKELIEKYEAVFNGLNISDIKGNVASFKNDQFELTFQMQTPLGKLKNETYSGKLVKEGGKYKVDWNYSFIFPEMKKGDKVFMSTETPKRGEILDINKQPLATSHDYPQLGIIPNKLGEKKEKEKNIETISKNFDKSVDEINQLLEQPWVKEDSFVPIKTIPFEESTDKYQSTGITLASVNNRYYPLKEAAAQLIGYTGKVTAEEIEKDKALSGFEETGKTGLEAQFDKELRGKTGGKIEIVNKDGESQLAVIEEKKQDGKDVQLTIDSQIQRDAFTALNNLPGSTVVTAPNTGQLKAAVSSPSYDPNQFILGVSQKEYDQLAKDKANPFLARFSAGYAPGSTFKAITAAIGIDEKVTTPDKTREISGLKWQKDSSWGGYQVTRVSDVPSVNMNTALVYSDNIYFAQEALEMGSKKYLDGLKKFPFGEKMNIHIPMTPAQISNDEIKSDILLSDTAYGQGQLLVNPIQQAVMYSAFANEGEVVFPQIIKGKENTKKERAVSKEAANAVKKALIETVENENGTAHPLSNGDNQIAAKTGTAEIKEKQDTKGQENSFILAFDANESNYLVVSLIEDAKGTSAVEQNKEFIKQLKR